MVKYDCALDRARLALAGPGGNSHAGPGINAPGFVRPDLNRSGSPKEFVSFVPQPFNGEIGSAPNTGSDKVMVFVPPLALFNDASQWTDRKYFVRPMPAGQNPDSNPLLRAQYFTPPPVPGTGLAAGQLNLQMQLGALNIQAAKLTETASLFYGG